MHPHPPHVVDAELATLLHDIVGPGETFRHRHHIQLAFSAVQRYGLPAAIDKVCGWIQQLARYQSAPQKYHHTVSRAWIEIVAHHVAADPACSQFDVFVERHPALLDKRLLSRHYRSATLASDQARGDWVPPDAVPFPGPADRDPCPGRASGADAVRPVAGACGVVL
jgi:hypothetical protein